MDKRQEEYREEFLEAFNGEDNAPRQTEQEREMNARITKQRVMPRKGRPIARHRAKDAYKKAA